MFSETPFSEMDVPLLLCDYCGLELITLHPATSEMTRRFFIFVPEGIPLCIVCAEVVGFYAGNRLLEADKSRAISLN